jgi:SAM-dependent methyltransferase
MSPEADPPGAPPPNEIEAARRAWVDAPSSCTAECGPYHRLWPTLRLLGLGSGPDRHAERFRRAVDEAVARARHDGRDPRLLIAGQADHAMAALVAEALGDRPASLVLLDRCPTPLAAARRHLDAVVPTVDIATEVADALAAPPPDAPGNDVDLAVTHSFLSQVPGDQRTVLLRALGGRLRPGGHLVTNTRLAPAGDDGRFDPDAADRLRALLVERGTRRPDLLPAPLPELADAVAPYVAAVRIHPVHAASEVADALASAGLEVVALAPVERGGAAVGPGTLQAATYLELVAQRPIS